MCLDTVDEKLKVTRGDGWKTFEGENRPSRPDPKTLGTWAFGARIPVGEWFTDPCGLGTSIRSLDGGWYPRGFHIHRDETDARMWAAGERRRVRKVSFRQVVATGVERAGFLKEEPVIVAREIYIYPKGKK